jgi:hypothetical protein
LRPAGAGERLCRSGPWQPGTPSQGYQLPFTPAELFRTALAAINKSLAGRPFAMLSPEEQDAYLKGLEAGGKDLGGVRGDVFFEYLWEATLEGYFSDPVYGGRDIECVVDRRMNRNEALSRFGRFEALHLSFSPAGKLRLRARAQRYRQRRPLEAQRCAASCLRASRSPNCGQASSGPAVGGIGKVSDPPIFLTALYIYLLH